MKDKICITGAGGLIGGYLTRLLSQQFGTDAILPITRNWVDLTSYTEVRHFFKTYKPQHIFHLAALTNNPECEKSPELTQTINVDLCQWISELNPKSWICHFSTDLVFNGLQGNYKETDSLSPLGIYAESKAKSEAVFSNRENVLIVRTSLNGGDSATGDRGFNEKLRISWQHGNSTPLFQDEFRNPIHALQTARILKKIFPSHPTGTYHIAGGTKMSRLEIGQLVAARWPGLTPEIIPSSIREYLGPPRAPDCSLDCSTIQKDFDINILGLPEFLMENPDLEF